MNEDDSVAAVIMKRKAENVLGRKDKLSKQATKLIRKQKDIIGSVDKKVS